MDQLISALYAIPILGFVFQFAGYLIDVLPQNAPIILQSATPIVLAALCGVMCERSGVVNIGIEGMMLTAAFVGWIVGVVLAPLLPADPSPFFGVTPALLIAFILAVLSAVAVALLHAWLSISVRADQIISGTIINILAAGLTAYLYTIVSASSPESAGYFPAFVAPTQLTDLPVIGWILAMFLNQGPIAISVIVIVIGFQIWLFRSRWGLRSRAVGEHPKAAETVGIDVIRMRYRNVLYGGVLAGLAGAYLSMEASNSFQAGMTERPRVHRPGRDDRRPMDADRRVRRGVALLVLAVARPDHQVRSAQRSARGRPAVDPRPVLRRAAIPGDDRRPGRVRRAEHPAGRRRPAVRARGRDLTRDERDRAAAYLDLVEGRGPVPVLDDAGIERVVHATHRIAIVGASSDPDRPSHGVFRSLVGYGLDCVPINPNEREVLGVPAFPTVADAVAATGPFDIVDVFRRPELCIPHAREAVAAGARVLWLQLGVVNWEAAAIAHDAGLEVVMDRCTAIEWRRFGRGAGDLSG